MNLERIQVLITAGKGPAECCWVVAQVLKTLNVKCIEQGFKVIITDRQQGMENGTLLSASLEVSGSGVRRYLNEWEGTLQWVGQSMFRKFHKRKNWFVGISLLDTTKQYVLKEHELEFQTFRASGPGGQHRNKVETAVRVIHPPTGISVSASESKSQHQNKQLALKKMKEAFHQQIRIQQRELINEKWREHLSLQRGNAIRVYEGRKFILKE